MPTTPGRIAAALCLTIITFATTPSPARAADIAAGRARAESCGACHGAQGVSAVPAIPSLAGQQDKFLQWQLVFFRTGRRANPIMGPLAASLSDEDVRNLGAYYASLPRGDTPATDADPALRAEGQALAEKYHCAACHTDTFGGQQAAPAIARQHRDYLAKALADYRSGARPSTGVAAMNEAASGLSDHDIAALSQFLSSYQ
jgi:cytochrome c553